MTQPEQPPQPDEEVLQRVRTMVEDQHERDVAALQTAVERRDHARTRVGRLVRGPGVFWRQLIVGESEADLESLANGILPVQFDPHAQSLMSEVQSMNTNQY